MEKDQFFMPAEWHRHEGCWMIWPKRTDVWRNGAKNARAVFAEIAMAIAKFEPVRMATDAKLIAEAQTYFSDLSNIEFVAINSNDAWARDIAPTFVINKEGERRINHWGFNAWGGLYDDVSADILVPNHIAQYENIAQVIVPLILEGGSIHVNSQGVLLTTEECLLNPNRNPQYNKEQIEDFLKSYLGVHSIIWLPLGVYNDETDGHIDNMACFLDDENIALTWTDDETDPQYQRSLDALHILEAKGFKVHKIHQPEPLYVTEAEAVGWQLTENSFERKAQNRMAASYINFYMANDAIILPQFDSPYDQKAYQFLKDFYPNKEIVPIYTREILLGGGNIHCITQQVPKGIINEA